MSILEDLHQFFHDQIDGLLNQEEENSTIVLDESQYSVKDAPKMDYCTPKTEATLYRPTEDGYQKIGTFSDIPTVDDLLW